MTDINTRESSALRTLLQDVEIFTGNRLNAVKIELGNKYGDPIASRFFQVAADVSQEMRAQHVEQLDTFRWDDVDYGAAVVELVLLSEGLSEVTDAARESLETNFATRLVGENSANSAIERGIKAFRLFRKAQENIA